ncbi:hypothetical protein A3H11_02730 [Candidatus Uhrbacteria bacterium RIFCSPLOWO2_12_FULL_47_10]|nr:MAG: hypothetical protein A2753_00365 [Candidatus Uhrbacteria bacterium RIFCSPHIGHO2_01_FULL_47_11]OGL69262.1 MAG: hypothetical protein A3D58_03130 [Candidatus Uhrbacteria bacterium RIFCSPHIGHO2_02_FULL_46_47]OGL85392.1 MAG: hypothetical protein A3J03_04910 [Candidatus Uhrbacteria bacterium RIFCSPLOWO2_02_FULL_46_25]OGL91824.1 MAG: hypothetical protein A3H11_02730 [Candidatus Uhrbacteria bacterium RIFCSPLOWO2_12_FULL_47_10]
MVGVSRHGAARRENVGISSTNEGENPSHRKGKVSWATQIVPGLVGPKARPKGVVDGQQVNIPALPKESFQGARSRSSRVFLDTHVPAKGNVKPQGGSDESKEYA